MYHYVDDQDGSLFVSPENFERQMVYLRDRGYRVISMDELTAGLKEGKEFSRNTVVITFDDGRRDNFTQAFPILSDYDYPATFYVTTGLIGSGSFMSWDDLRLMSAEGMDIGSHTRSHVYLPDIDSPEALREEIAGSRRDIIREIGQVPKHFCYPIGGFTLEAKAMVKRYGYSSAVTTNRGPGKRHDDLYALQRVKVSNSDAVKPFHFFAKLSGYYNLFRSEKAGY
ncbi:MAG: polysaccharide deacetylase family protein [Candidatus Omnitrophota bacterium]